MWVSQVSDVNERPGGEKDALPRIGGEESHDLRIVEVDPLADRRYQAFISSHPKALVFHHPGWLRSLEEEYEGPVTVLACETSDGRLEGILPLVRTRGLPFNVGSQQTRHRLSSLPRTPLAGPVSTSNVAMKLLLEAAVDRAAAEPGVQLQIKSKDLFEADLTRAITCTEWRPTHVLEIPQRCEELRFGGARNRHNIKWAVKKAEQNGMSVRTAERLCEVKAWYSLYLQTMRRNSVPPRPLRLFTALWRNLRPVGLLSLELAEQEIGGRKRLVAGSIFLKFGDTLWYAFTGIEDDDLSLHANDLILWKSINVACGSGVHWLDFGEVAEDHPELIRFKTKWGTVPQKQYRYYSCSCPQTTDLGRTEASSVALRMLKRAWQHLPLPITARLGDFIYRRL